MNYYFNNNGVDMWISNCNNWQVYGNVMEADAGNICFKISINIDIHDNIVIW